MYEKSKDTSEQTQQQPAKEIPNNQPIDFQFPDPKTL